MAPRPILRTVFVLTAAAWTLACEPPAASADTSNVAGAPCPPAAPGSNDAGSRTVPGLPGSRGLPASFGVNLPS